MTAIRDLADRLDTEGMIGHVRNFPRDCATSFNRLTIESHPWSEDLSNRVWSSFLLVGMGGSAAGGSFLSDLVARQGSAPVHIQRDHGLPSWWDPSVLVIATSYSGNTEETLDVVESAIDSGGTVVAICSGGLLAGLAEINDSVHLVLVPPGQPPRSAFGHLFATQLSLAWTIGLLQRPVDASLVRLVDSLSSHVKKADFITDPNADSLALATELLDRPIAIIAPTELTGVAERFRNQLNENSARFARVAILPEMNHNELVAWGGEGREADPTSPEQGLLLFTWAGMNPRIKQRMDWFVEHLSTEHAWGINCEGEDLLEAMLHACIDMDWISCALALLEGKDPSSIGPITALKEHLSSVD